MNTGIEAAGFSAVTNLYQLSSMVDHAGKHKEGVEAVGSGIEGLNGLKDLFGGDEKPEKAADALTQGSVSALGE